MSLKTQDLFDVSNKVVVVTGGSRGIGEMITSGFLANNSKVYITARKEEALVKKAEELSQKYSCECIPISGDISNSEGIDALVNFLNDVEPEGIDYLINNAGAAWGANYDDFPESNSILIFFGYIFFANKKCCLANISVGAITAT